MLIPPWFHRVEPFLGVTEGRKSLNQKRWFQRFFWEKKWLAPKNWGRNDPQILTSRCLNCAFSETSKNLKTNIVPMGFEKNLLNKKDWIQSYFRNHPQKQKIHQKTGKKSTPNPHLAIESSTQKKRKQQKKTLRKRGRAWVVVTPAASLVEPPSRCQNVTSGVGGFLGHPFFSLPKGSTFLDFCRKSMES